MAPPRHTRHPAPGSSWLRRVPVLGLVAVVALAACSPSAATPTGPAAPTAPGSTPQATATGPAGQPTAGPTQSTAPAPTDQPGARPTQATVDPAATPTPPGATTGPPQPTATATAVPQPTATAAPPEPVVSTVACPLEGHPPIAAPADPGPVDRTGVTRIAIDGRGDDWIGRSVVETDASADAEPGFPDLTVGRSFVNRDALYLLLQTDKAGADFDSLEIDFDTPDRRLRVGWGRESDRGWVADVSTGWEFIRDTSFSSFAFDEAFEGRLDLRDLGSPESVEILKVEVMVGECCGPTWRSADTWTASRATPVVGEVDPAWRVALPQGALEDGRKLAPPDTRRIALDYDAEARMVTVTGSAGAVPDRTRLLIGNLELNDFVTPWADAEGRLSARVAAAPGTHILIKQDTTGRIIRDERRKFNENMIAPGVLLRVPFETSPGGVAFAAGGRICCDVEAEVSWTIEGAFERQDLEPGSRMRVTAQAAIWADETARPPSVWIPFQASLLADAGGRQVGRAGKFVTPFLTPTGLPIERTMGGPPVAPINVGGQRANWRFEGGRWVTDIDTELFIPRTARHGLYNLTAGPIWGVQDAGLVRPASFRPFVITVRDNHAYASILGTIKVGDAAAMRLATTLLADELSEGSRGGVIAREDAGAFDIAPRAVTRHDPVLPRLDAYGEPWPYRLEPYAVMLDAIDRALPAPPTLQLDYAGSWLEVAVERPDGQTDVLGPAQLVQYAVKSPRTPWELNVGSGGGELRELPQLQGPGDTFAYRFPTDGDYVIRLNGRVNDLQGRTHHICGTFDLTIANVLDIETSFLPGTPFEIGDSVAPTVTVMPGVPADVAYTITHVSADGGVTAETYTGQANEFGWWDGDGDVWTFEGDGEYRVDVDARYTDPAGNLWAGRLRFGSAVATPNAPIVAHGRRGSDGLRTVPPPWAFDSDLPFRDDVTAPPHALSLLHRRRALGPRREDSRPLSGGRRRELRQRPAP